MAAAALEKVINSKEFKDLGLAGIFVNTNGVTNQQLFNRIPAAHEEQGAGCEDGVIDLFGPGTSHRER